MLPPGIYFRPKMTGDRAIARLERPSKGFANASTESVCANILAGYFNIATWGSPSEEQCGSWGAWQLKDPIAPTIVTE